MDTQGPMGEGEGRAERPFPRLVWSNPQPAVRAETAVRPRSRVDFALAIERQLAGADGLSREQFLALYSGRRATPLALAPLPS